MGLRDEFLKIAATRESKEFDCGLSQPVTLLQMSNALMADYEVFASNPERTARQYLDMKWKMIRQCVVDCDGEALLKVGDRTLFDNWPSKITDSMFVEIAKLSSVNKEAVEDLEKN